MTEFQPAHYTAGACHTAQGDRLIWSSIICGEGVTGPGDLEVTAGAAGLTVDIDTGAAFVQGDNVANQGVYHVVNLGTVTLTLDPADPVDNRIDLIVATVRDSAYAGADDDWLLEVITGSPGPAPTPPSLPPNSLPLAEVTVPALATAPGELTVTDVRTEAVLCDGLIPASVSLSQIQARMSRQATQSLPNAVTTNLIFDTTTYNDGMTVGAGGITAVTPGRYRVTIGVGLGLSTTDGIMHTAVTVNGTGVRTLMRGAPAANAPTVQNVTTTLMLNAGQTVGVGVFHTNGGARSLQGGTNYETFIEVEWMHS